MQKTVPKYKKNNEVYSVDFDKNDKVVLICGSNDEILAYIEEKLAVSIHITGNHMEVVGSSPNCEHAIMVMQHLYRHSSDRMCSVNEADVAIRNIIPKNLLGNTLPLRTTIATPCKKITARTLNQERYIELINSNSIVFGMGVAGTGKTYLAVACACLFLKKNLVDRIILARPAIGAGENLGFLPGDMREKVDPYIKPLFDGLQEMLGPTYIEKAIDKDIIEIAPLAYMRGRTLSNAFVVLDEAQNATAAQLKMFLSRFGEGSKMVINGDPSQSDLISSQNAFAKIVESIEGIKDIGVVKFDYHDVVRHRLVSQILKVIEKNDL